MIHEVSATTVGFCFLQHNLSLPFLAPISVSVSISFVTLQYQTLLRCQPSTKFTSHLYCMPTRISWSLHCAVLTQELRLKGRSPPGLVCLWRQWKECSKLLLALMWIAGNSCELLGSNLHYLRSHFIAKPDFKETEKWHFTIHLQKKRIQSICGHPKCQPLLVFRYN